MFLALRELRFARSRFALMGAVVALIAVLMVLLSGLSSGLVNDGVSGLRRMPVTAFGFADGTRVDGAFSRSVVDARQVEAWRGQPGVEAAEPFGNVLVNAHSGTGTPIDLALFGVRPGSFLDPTPASGSRLGSADGLVVSSTLLDAGLHLGDTVTIDRLGVKLTVVGLPPTSGRSGTSTWPTCRSTPGAGSTPATTVRRLPWRSRHVTASHWTSRPGTPPQAPPA
jgi:putative ABC transport system permease protein